MTQKTKNIIYIITTTLIITLLIFICTNKAIFKSQKQENKLQKTQITQTNTNQVKNEAKNVEEDTSIDLTKYYKKADQTLNKLTQEEIIAQIFLVGTYQNSNIQKLQQKQFGGYLFFTDFFKNKTQQQIQNEIKNLQSTSKIPLLIAVDEEGGKVVRVSSNKKLIKEKFQSSSDIYNKGGFEAITKDTINKSKFLENLGINLNLAPVVDIATDPKAYIYERSFKKQKQLTATYATTVINASKFSNISYTLKHFPRLWKQYRYTYRHFN